MNTASNATRATPTTTYKWGVIALNAGFHINGAVALGWFKTRRLSEGFALTQVQRGNFKKEDLALTRWYGA